VSRTDEATPFRYVNQILAPAGLTWQRARMATTASTPSPATTINTVLPTFEVRIRESSIGRVVSATGATSAEAVRNASVLFLQATLPEEHPENAMFVAPPAAEPDPNEPSKKEAILFRSSSKSGK
jgi:hypothetical protein